MVKIEIRRISNYLEASIIYDHIRLELGLLNKLERKELAAIFKQAAEELLDGADKK